MKRSTPQWTFWHSSLVGIPWENWRRLLRDNRVETGYRHRAVYLSAMSLRASIYRRKEERKYGTAIEATQIEEAPVFILGHWRSGATHLHNLLACDNDQFASPTSIEACYPYTFLTTEADVRMGKDNTPDILQRHTDMYDAYFARRALIPPGQLHELRYEDLVADPIGQLRAVYQHLALPGFEALRPHLRQYVESVAGYAPNRFEAPSPQDRELVAHGWSRSFEEWGYFT